MPLDKETLDILNADDILSRVYKNTQTGTIATLFVAYFQTQRTGKTPHSPKNCLPGSGWVPSESGVRYDSGSRRNCADQREPLCSFSRRQSECRSLLVPVSQPGGRERVFSKNFHGRRFDSV